jgi:tRNA-specific 2-thiouridylase
MKQSQKIVVAMSGGVDSSVAAALLVQQGYQVTGVMLRLWSEPEQEEYNRCCTPEAMAMARRVAAILNIPFYAIDAKQVFYDEVVQYFMSDYANGITPNPCLKCNRLVRWGFLLNQAIALGAVSMATGHYARLLYLDEDGIQMLRGVDPSKDQSYVLHMLNQKQLSQTIFPLGGYTKIEVRQIARDLGLPISERPDSQDLCFLGKNDYRDFLLSHMPQVEKHGPIVDRKGKQLGEHRGLAFYTIGQRKGLGIYSPFPYYVLAKDVSHNTLVIGSVEELGSTTLTVGEVSWVSGQAPSAPFRAQIKIRYKAQDSWGTVFPGDDSCAQVRFDEPLRDITPGQAAVFYDGEVCLGGGIILGEDPL